VLPELLLRAPRHDPRGEAGQEAGVAFARHGQTSAVSVRLEDMANRERDRAVERAQREDAWSFVFLDLERRPQLAPQHVADVAPLFAAKCAGCHQDGGVAPFSLTSALQAKAYAPAIVRMTRSGAMPPWMPGADSSAYLGSSRRILTLDEKFLIAAWVRGGAK